MKKYKKRIADKLLQNQLEAAGVVLIQGPKWCGKTTTAEQVAKSVIYMDNPTNRAAYLSLSESDPLALLKGETPRLIDEWQLTPSLWDAARFDVSHKGETGLYIFTGSSVPVDSTKLAHTGTGRVGKLTMRPMSMWESGESNGSVGLGDLFNQKFSPAASNAVSVEDLCYLICRGGWPGSLELKPKAALLQAKNYVDIVADSDISRADGVSRSSAFARRLMRSYARHQGQQVPVSTIFADVQIHDDEPSLSEDTITSYINALKKIFVVEDVEAWNPNLRSKTAIRTSDTRYFVDPSIATAVCGIGPDELSQDLNTLGLLFETMCVRDLRVYAEALDGSISHYRDKNGLECDIVVHLRNGSYGLIEVKLGGDTLIEEGAKSLKNLSAKIDTTKMKEPSFLMVLTGLGEFAYRRPDGVLVVPVSCLKD